MKNVTLGANGQQGTEFLSFAANVKTNFKKILHLLILLIVVGLLPKAGEAQEELRILGDADPIEIYLTLTDSSGVPMGGLDVDAFQVLEDGSEQVIENLSLPTDRTITRVFIMDYSGSIRDADALIPMEHAVYNVIDLMDSNDQAAVIKFNGDIGVEVSQAITSDKEFLKNAVSRDPGGRTNTNLYDAIKEAVDLLNEIKSVSNSSAIILLTDGDDNASTTTLNELLNDLDSANIPLFIIGLGEVIDTSLLQKMSNATGGEYASAAHVTELNAIYDDLANRLKNEYLISYFSAINDCDDHNLKILIDTQQGLKTFESTFARCFPEITPSVDEENTQPVATKSRSKNKWFGAAGLFELISVTLLLLSWRTYHSRLRTKS